MLNYHLSFIVYKNNTGYYSNNKMDLNLKVGKLTILVSMVTYKISDGKSNLEIQSELNTLLICNI